MKILNTKTGNEVKIFTDNIEESALSQIENLCNSDDYCNSEIRIMPDVHAGKGCTIGTTMHLNGKVSPNLVGVDIGCGMLAVRIIGDINLKKLDAVINNYIPHGFNVHSKSEAKFDFSNLVRRYEIDEFRAQKSLGTLGGGNHFIEIAKGNNDGNYLIIHSGSRGVGNQIAKLYQDTAIKNMLSINTGVEKLIAKLKNEGREKDIETELSKLTKKNNKLNKELASLSGKEYIDYISDVVTIQKYASLNRKTIAHIIMNKMSWTSLNSFETIHNYIEVRGDKHILRKGAVRAERDELLIIPMNMRDGSLLCKGKGNKDWNYSAPHGAGRLMSRSKAKKELDLDVFKRQMEDVYSTSVNDKTLDEAPNAYKSMDEIISNISDTVDIIDILKPIYNFKSY